jgi:hypothetical protein
MPKEKTMHELAQEFPEKTYRELEIYREKDRQQEAGVCVMGEMRKDREFEKEIDYHRYWKNMYEKEHKLRQEAEGELSIMKGIETNRVKEAQDALANALEVNESHQKLNGKLQERLTELEEENKKMHDAFDKRMDSARKAGL